jgi:hypothetical protein
MTRFPFNSHMFDVTRLDTDVLTPQIHIVAQVQTAARYRGTVTDADGTSRMFSLVVVPSPAEPSVNLDVSQTWNTDPTFTVVEKGYIVVSVLKGAGGQTIRILNDTELLLDNKSLRKDQIVIFRVLRPGKHTLRDQTGSGTSSITVQYPQKNPPIPTTPIDVQVVQIDPKTTQMKPDNIVSSVRQPLVIHVQDRSHLITALEAVTDRVGDRYVTRVQPDNAP